MSKSVMLGIIFLLSLSLAGEYFYYDSKFSRSGRFAKVAFKLGVVRGLDITDNGRCFKCDTYGDVAGFAWSEFVEEE